MFEYPYKTFFRGMVGKYFMHSRKSSPVVICRPLPLGIPTKNLPYLLTGESFHLGTTVVLLRSRPLFWHIIQFYHQPASRLRSIFMLLHLILLFSFLGHVPQIVSLHSNHLYCLSFSVRQIVGLMIPILASNR